MRAWTRKLELLATVGTTERRLKGKRNKKVGNTKTRESKERKKRHLGNHEGIQRGLNWRERDENLLSLSGEGL